MVINLSEISKENFKGIWIPIEILKLKDISQTEKLLLSVVISLDSGDGCYATNRYFSELFGVSKDRITRIISELTKKEYLNSEIIFNKNSKKVEKRTLKAVNRKSNGNIPTEIPRQSQRESLDSPSANADTPPGVKYKEYNKDIDKKEDRKEDINYSCCNSSSCSSSSNAETFSESSSPTNSDAKKPRQKQAAFDHKSEPYMLAAYLEEGIQQHSPQVKENEANRQRWARDIDKMIRIDKLDPDDIAKVIKWCQQDKFWCCNILSGNKLREKYMQLDIKMRSEWR